MRSHSISFGFALLVCVGCSKSDKGPKTVPVTGTVQYKGAPVEGATVTLVPNIPTVRSASGVTDAEGKFSVMTYVGPSSQPQGAMPGDYIVLISKMQTAEIPMGLSPQEEQAAFAKAGKPKSLLPKAYQSPMTSKFKVKVEERAPDALVLDLKD